MIKYKIEEFCKKFFLDRYGELNGMAITTFISFIGIFILIIVLMFQQSKMETLQNNYALKNQEYEKLKMESDESLNNYKSLLEEKTSLEKEILTNNNTIQELEEDNEYLENIASQLEQQLMNSRNISNNYKNDFDKLKNILLENGGGTFLAIFNNEEVQHIENIEEEIINESDNSIIDDLNIENVEEIVEDENVEIIDDDSKKESNNENSTNERKEN